MLCHSSSHPALFPFSHDFVILKPQAHPPAPHNVWSLIMTIHLHVFNCVKNNWFRRHFIKTLSFIQTGLASSLKMPRAASIFR